MALSEFTSDSGYQSDAGAPVTERPAVSADVESLLHAVCKVWSAHSGADLDLHQVQLKTPSDYKKFCVGLLENPDTHPWKRALSRVDGRKALSVAGSLFLFRKALPAEWSVREMCQSHRAAMIPSYRPERSPLPDGYLQHVRKLVASQFPKGWDRGYVSHCWSSTPSVGASLEVPRSKGGTRAEKLCRARFLRRVLGKEYFEVNNLVRYSVVPTGGKGRGVTVASSDLGLLHPVHKTMYDHMSTLPWVLRGEAKTSCFKGFERKDGEVFVSGDYESASDNLRVEVADVIIDVLQSSSKIPSTVWEACRAFLRCKILYPDLEIPLESEGQLMGNVPVKINGDDIVFRCPRHLYEKWADCVSSLGLVLSRGKTLVHPVYFSLNSAFFWSRKGRKPRPIPVTRVSAFTKEFEDWGSLAGSYRSFTRGFVKSAKFQAEVIFLNHFRRRIRQAGRSVRRGLGVPASIPALQVAGLWRRECWYFDSVPAEFDVLPSSPSRLKWGSVPEGWKRVPATSVRLSGKVEFHREGEILAASVAPNVDDLQKVFWSALTSRTWTESPTRGKLVDDYRQEVLATGFEGLFRRWKKKVKVIVLPNVGRSLRGSGPVCRHCGSRPCSAPHLAPFCKQKGSREFINVWKSQCKCRPDCPHKGFRVDPSKALSWEPPKRVRLVWAPFDKDTGKEEECLVSVEDLLEYEPLGDFSPPDDYFAIDPRFNLGYR
ncbi:RNA-dependent RNA polymerase [Fusarium mangiferae botourmiavirus 3]|nr:RNA-dependent RNA polymerase [Fusarium mangiferae botourmiavirus 3]